MEKINLKTEKQIVLKAQSGDRNALSSLVSLYENRIYHLALRMLGNEQDAEDILQETFMVMLNKIHQFEGNSSFYTWLYRIAVNLGLRLIKSRSPEKFNISLDDPDSEQIKNEVLSEWHEIDYEKIGHKHIRSKINSVLKELPGMYRTIFILRDLHGTSVKDTSKILNISESNTKIRLMRARNFLKEKLEKIVKEEDLL